MKNWLYKYENFSEVYNICANKTRSQGYYTYTSFILMHEKADIGTLAYTNHNI